MTANVTFNVLNYFFSVALEVRWGNVVDKKVLYDICGFPEKKMFDVVCIDIERSHVYMNYKTSPRTLPWRTLASRDSILL